MRCVKQALVIGAGKTIRIVLAQRFAQPYHHLTELLEPQAVLLPVHQRLAHQSAVNLLAVYRAVFLPVKAAVAH